MLSCIRPCSPVFFSIFSPVFLHFLFQLSRLPLLPLPTHTQLMLSCIRPCFASGWVHRLCRRLVHTAFLVDRFTHAAPYAIVRTIRQNPNNSYKFWSDPALNPRPTLPNLPPCSRMRVHRKPPPLHHFITTCRPHRYFVVVPRAR